MQEPPMRMTLVYSGITLYVFTMSAIWDMYLKYHISNLYGYRTSLVLIMMTVREPLIVFWATKITEANQRVDREEARQKALQVELEEAQKRRAEARKRWGKLAERRNTLQVELEEAQKRREIMKAGSIQRQEVQDDEIDQISLGEDEIKTVRDPHQDDTKMEQLDPRDLLERSNKILHASHRKVAWV